MTSAPTRWPLTLDRDDLQQAIDQVAPAVPRKASLPILAHVLLACHGDEAELRATNLDLEIGVRIPAECDGSFEVALPAMAFRDLVRELPAGGVRFRTTLSHRVTVVCGHGEFELPGVDASEWPASPSLDYSGEEILTARDLLTLVARTGFAASSDDSRPVLNGILIERLPENLHFTATTGHVLATASLPLPRRVDVGRELIVPATAFRPIAKLFAGSDDLELGFSEHHLGFRTSRAFLSTRLVAGPYPNYRQVIPSDNDKRLVVDRARLAALLRRIDAVSSDQSHGVIGLAEAAELRIEAAGDLFGGHEAIAIEYDGPTFEFGVSAGYLLEVLERIPTDEVSVSFKRPNTALVLEPVEWNAPGTYLTLVMPQRLVGDRSLSLEADGHPMGGSA